MPLRPLTGLPPAAVPDHERTDPAECGEHASDESDQEQSDIVKPRRRRRASLPAPPGSDPEPYDPPVEPRGEAENDERLRADRPPHWG